MNSSAVGNTLGNSRTVYVPPLSVRSLFGILPAFLIAVLQCVNIAVFRKEIITSKTSSFIFKIKLAASGAQDAKYFEH